MTAEVRRFLTVSTAHLRPELDNGPEAEIDWGPALASEMNFSADVCGFWLWVPNDPRESALADVDDMPEWVLAVQLRARDLGCDYVLFDPDAEELDGLSVWCHSCGGGADNAKGCRDCCRDCGMPCSHDTDSEGFHADEARP
jgi:hypothetical protein